MIRRATSVDLRCFIVDRWSLLCLGMVAKQVWDAVGAEAGDNEMTEVVYNVWRLVCPLILVGPRVEEVYIRVNEQEYSAVMTIT